MDFDVLGDLNWIAVIVAGLAYYFLGAIWFMPAVAGKTWMRSIGWDPQAEPPKMTAKTFVGPLVAYIVAAAALGMIARTAGLTSVGDGLVLGLVAGIGLAGMILYVTAVFDPKSPEPMTWFGVSFAYHFVGILLASVIVAAWD